MPVQAVLFLCGWLWNSICVLNTVKLFENLFVDVRSLFDNRWQITMKWCNANLPIMDWLDIVSFVNIEIHLSIVWIHKTLTLNMLNCFKDHKDTFTFWIVSWIWLELWNNNTCCLSYPSNAMPADALVEANASVGMVLTPKARLFHLQDQKSQDLNQYGFCLT